MNGFLMMTDTVAYCVSESMFLSLAVATA